MCLLAVAENRIIALLTRPILEVCAWTAAKGVSAGSGVSMSMFLRKKMRKLVGILKGVESLKGFGDLRVVKELTIGKK